MPPKPSGQQPSKKTETKAKQKILDDKTFGLKNKNKSAKVSKYIQTLESNLKSGGRKTKKDEEDARLAKDRKKQEEAKKAELAALFKPVIQQKVPFGVDPKTVVCAYFKSGQCQKGDKCKFSHDLAVERRSAKINPYEDIRDAQDISKSDDKMDSWDQTKLLEVVSKKHGPATKATTDLVCRHFLEAIEQRKYGWFWECPNGNEKCKYRHALPPDFVLKTAKTDEEAPEQEEISLEEFLDIERHKIQKGTPVTAESFAKWKADRKLKQEVEEQAREKTKEAEIKAGKLLNFSGRDLFTYNPDLFAESDDDEALDVDYTHRSDDGDIDEALFLEEGLEDLEIDNVS